MKKKWFWIFGISILLFGLLLYLFIRTGFLQAAGIDNRDSEKWNFSDENIIMGAEEFSINGPNETCWLLIHSYTSTPKEMNELASRINSEFGDSVLAPRLKGHGMLPSKINDLSLDDWYSQVESIYLDLDKNCDRVNVVGSSIGGALAMKLSENHNLNNLYLLNAYLFPPYHFYYGFSLNTYMKYLTPILHYSKKKKLAQINDDDKLKEHIAYSSMPYAPMKNSFGFFEDVESNLELIDEPVLIQHSTGDKVSPVEVVGLINSSISSDDKKVVFFEKSNHVLLFDFDREEATQNIIDFERHTR